MAFREREMGQSPSSLLRPSAALQNAGEEGVSYTGKEAIPVTLEPTANAAALVRSSREWDMTP